MTSSALRARSTSTARREALASLFDETRARTLALVDGLPAEDLVVQSMEDASPAKWHLAHTTWFFETFVLAEAKPDYRSPDDRFAYLFNSYYVQAGPRFARPQRGLVTRPTVSEVIDYRRCVDDAVAALLDGLSDEADAALLDRIELGCHHEMQHQELLVTDLLHALSFNPLMPAFKAPAPTGVGARLGEPAFASFAGGMVEIGHPGDGFAYDCEGPRHRALLEPFKLATRPVTAGEWIAFIEDGGYREPTLWLSDGWATAQREGWEAPLYWWERDGEWWAFGLRGAQPVNRDAPVTHVSYFEADAFARWAGKRLPSEQEWESVAAANAIDGNFLDNDALRPLPAAAVEGSAAATGGIAQLWGDVWEWTRSPFAAYPGFKPATGAIGEYNGKFMCSQFVLRGGSCVTPRAQMRHSYRNFFYPHQRWQFTGVRLAEDDRG